MLDPARDDVLDPARDDVSKELDPELDDGV